MMAWLRGHANYRLLGQSLQLSTVIHASCVRKWSSMEQEVEGTNHLNSPIKPFGFCVPYSK